MNGSNRSNDEFSPQELQIIGIAQVVSGSISLVGCLAMLLVILFNRRYNTSTERIILYLNIAILFNSSSYIVRGGGYDIIEYDDGKDTPFCKFAAYFGQLTGSFILATISCLIFEIFLSAILNKKIGKFEVVYPVAIFLLPIFTAAIPFFTDNYGKSGPWCWIKGEKYIGNETTDPLGTAFQYGLYYVPAFILIVLGGGVYLLAVYILRRKLKWHEENYNTMREVYEQKKMLSDLKRLRWYPLVYFLINLILVIVRIINAVNNSFGDKENRTILVILWTISGVVQGLQGFLIALTFTLVPLDKKERWSDVRMCCGSMSAKFSLSWRKRFSKLEEDKPLLIGTRGVTLDDSSSLSISLSEETVLNQKQSN